MFAASLVLPAIESVLALQKLSVIKIFEYKFISEGTILQQLKILTVSWLWLYKPHASGSGQQHLFLFTESLVWVIKVILLKLL